jgi:aspartyl/glutamyl-tRNA(Asn/Gln) amidotransferase C subunit
MSEQISRETFDHLVDLAALELDEQQSEYLRKELNAQLASITQLVAIPIPEGTEPARHGVEYPPQRSAVPRKDEWLPYPDPDAILAQAPQTEGRFFVVPDIPHTKMTDTGEENA